MGRAYRAPLLAALRRLRGIELIYTLLWIGCAIMVVVCLSYFGGVAYIYSLVGISALVFGGHLITFDDDLKGGWSNPDGDPSVGLGSLIELAVKFLVLALLVYLVFQYPEVRQWGASV
jgi:hypothetical protein